MGGVAQPSGTVTLVFTDIEGSTRLLHELGTPGYKDALAEHRRVVREACARYSGYEVDYEGDAFFYAFSSTTDAVSAVSEAMQALKDGPISIRVGIHTGEPEPDPPKYVGMDVHTAARIMSAGHGGQVVVSPTTASLLAEQETHAGALPALASLGSHRLKDLAEPITLYQLGDGSFPPLKTIANSNLPTPASSFLGREEELNAADELLQQTRLLTIAGPGGQGKTRFSLELARRAREERFSDYPDGVFSVFLSSLRDPALVLASICQTLSVREQPGSRALETLVSHLQGKKLLLLLDNLEHLLDAASELSVLLRQADGLTLLVTSRELLRIQGEEPYALPPLADEEGIALFCERSKLEPSPTIAHIATRLEGLPLALELAAARTRILTPAQLLERLSSRLDLLTGGRDADPRQQTLRATIEWSYDLLSPAEQELFARLSVFQGGCTLGAAEEVAHADLDALQSLVDKSLLRFTDERFWMLETLREFAEEKLEEAGDADGTRERHLAHFVAVAQRAEPELKRANQTRFLDELAADHGNFRAALEHGLHGSGSADLSARLAVALTEFWDIRCYFTDSSAWFAAVLEQRGGVPLAVRASALHGAGLAAHRQGDHARAIELYAASLEAHETTRDLAGQARTLGSLAYAYMWLEQVGEAVHHAERSVAIAEASGDPWITACALAALGGARVEEGNESEAEALYEESRRLFAEVGDGRNEAIEQLNLGCLAIAKGAYERADSLLADSASAARVYGDTSQASYALMHRAEVALRLGSYRDACGELREAMLLGGTSLNVVPRCLIGVALLANSAGDDERVLRLVGAVGALVDESQLESTADHFWKPSLFELRRQLDGERLDKATDHWRLVPLQDAVDEALDALLHLEPVVANQVPA